MGIMSKSFLLVFLLLVLVVMSHFEWRQLLESDMESNPGESENRPQLKREEVIKEKIILTQEKKIQRLNDLLTRLKEQLQHCRSTNETINGAVTSLTETGMELEQHIPDE